MDIIFFVFLQIIIFMKQKVVFLLKYKCLRMKLVYNYKITYV